MLLCGPQRGLFALHSMKMGLWPVPCGMVLRTDRASLRQRLKASEEGAKWVLHSHMGVFLPICEVL